MVIVSRRVMVSLLAAAAVRNPEWQGTELRLVSVHEAAAQESLSFARYPDPVLREAGQAVQRFDDDLAKTVRKLQAARKREGAVGLAATQCGVDAKIVVLDDDTVFVNPEIIKRNDIVDCWIETCLVLPPDVSVETLRLRDIDVRARDLRGRPFATTLTGEKARAMQHEMDHARGILIIDHAYDLPDSRAFPPLKDIETPLHTQRRNKAYSFL